MSIIRTIRNRFRQPSIELPAAPPDHQPPAEPDSDPLCDVLTDDHPAINSVVAAIGSLTAEQMAAWQDQSELKAAYRFAAPSLVSLPDDDTLAICLPGQRARQGEYRSTDVDLPLRDTSLRIRVVPLVNLPVRHDGRRRWLTLAALQKRIALP